MTNRAIFGYCLLILAALLSYATAILAPVIGISYRWGQDAEFGIWAVTCGVDCALVALVPHLLRKSLE